MWLAYAINNKTHGLESDANVKMSYTIIGSHNDTLSFIAHLRLSSRIAE